MNKRIGTETIHIWRNKAISFLLAHGLTPASITTGRDAWTVAHKCGFCIEAYDKLGVNDAHIQTALGYIFPNAVFKDAKRY